MSSTTIPTSSDRCDSCLKPTVSTFGRAAALLNREIAGKVDCFVLDYKMMSGIDLAKRLRNHHVGTPIILITGYPDESIQEKGRSGWHPSRSAEVPS
jgi:FixJ family two-component response regulator